MYVRVMLSTVEAINVMGVVQGRDWELMLETSFQNLCLIYNMF